MLKHISLFVIVAASVVVYMGAIEPEWISDEKASNPVAISSIDVFPQQTSDFAMMETIEHENPVSEVLEQEGLTNIGHLITHMRTAGCQPIVDQLVLSYPQSTQAQKNSIIQLLKSVSTSESLSGLLALTKVDDGLLLMDLNEAIEETVHVQWDATYAGKLSNTLTTALLDAEYSDETIKSVQRSIVSIGSPEAIEQLILSAHNKAHPQYERNGYTDSLLENMAKLDNKTTIPVLKKLLKQPDIAVDSIAFTAIGEGLVALPGGQGAQALLDIATGSEEATGVQLALWYQRIVNKDESLRAMLVQQLADQKFDSVEVEQAFGQVFR